MHMADALLSPGVGVAMAALSISSIGYAVKKIGREENFDEKNIPIMAVSGAFIFAAQMINFAIPGTGASGHIGGGILLAALLGPVPALLTMAAVLIIQCLFFADGGLLALGANLFNLGVLVTFVAFPFFYKPFFRKGITAKRLTFASLTAVVMGLQLGSLGVVLETLASDVTELPFSMFLLLMQPIHLAIGIVEGIITAAVLNFVYAMRPEILEGALSDGKMGGKSLRPVLGTLLVLALITGGVLSLFASSMPDGLEWALERVRGTISGGPEEGMYALFNGIQNFFSFMPEYAFKNQEPGGTSAAGILGGLLTLVVVAITGIVLRYMKKRKAEDK